MRRSVRRAASLNPPYYHAGRELYLIGNHSAATSHSVLPWFRSRSELDEAPKAAPRRKLTASGDFKLHSNADWESLKQQVATGKRFERLVVEPTDCDLIRNADFARDLADFAASNKIVIELAGAYSPMRTTYFIVRVRRLNAQTCLAQKKKLLNITSLSEIGFPRLSRHERERVEVVRLSGDALTSALRHKLVEEAFEALDAKSGDDLVNELADVEEIISGLRRALKLSKIQIEAERLDKQKRRGGFQRGYMLTKTLTPHSLRKQSVKATLDLQPKTSENGVISRSVDIPSTPTYRRPDLRQVEQELEKSFVFETDIKEVENLTEAVNFSLPIHDGDPQEFWLTVEIRRNKSSLRSSVRLRLKPAQLSQFNG